LCVTSLHALVLVRAARGFVEIPVLAHLLALVTVLVAAEFVLLEAQLLQVGVGRRIENNVLITSTLANLIVAVPHATRFSGASFLVCELELAIHHTCERLVHPLVKLAPVVLGAFAGLQQLALRLALVHRVIPVAF